MRQPQHSVGCDGVVYGMIVQITLSFLFHKQWFVVDGGDGFELQGCILSYNDDFWDAQLRLKLQFASHS